MVKTDFRPRKRKPQTDQCQPWHGISFFLGLISNDAGVLGRVCTIVGDLGANISDMEFLDRKPDFFKLILTVDLRDVEHLHAILSRLDAENAVATVLGWRINWFNFDEFSLNFYIHQPLGMGTFDWTLK